MHPLPRLRALLLAAVLAALAAAAAAPSAGAAPAYVALGDSYASGTGTRSYVSDGTSCQRSTFAYPSLVASARGYALNLRACSGARIPDVQSTQLSALGTGTAYASLSVGGNDAGFAGVLTECAQPAWLSDCNTAVDRANAYIDRTLPGALGTLYASVRSRAPRATVVVSGYPRIFNGEDCNAFTWFSPAEEARLNATADRLNGKLAAAASARGFAFANPTSRFVGHAVCDSPEWLNGLSNPVSESYHPNRLGHASGYAPVVSPLLTGSAVTRGRSPAAREAAVSAGFLARSQRPYAARDRAIEPERVVAPNLRSAKARRAARRAGVDLTSRASIDAVDRRYAAVQARER